MVESMLQQCGYRTGLFTSPHLVDVRERIRLQGSALVLVPVLADWHAARLALYALLKMCGYAKAMHPVKDVEQH